MHFFRLMVWCKCVHDCRWKTHFRSFDCVTPVKVREVQILTSLTETLSTNKLQGLKLKEQGEQKNVLLWVLYTGTVIHEIMVMKTIPQRSGRRWWGRCNVLESSCYSRSVDFESELFLAVNLDREIWLNDKLLLMIKTVWCIWKLQKQQINRPSTETNIKSSADGERSEQLSNNSTEQHNQLLRWRKSTWESSSTSNTYTWL